MASLGASGVPELTISDLGSIGEFVGAVAVLASLVYLALQIRQNTRTVRTATAQAIQSAMNEVHAHVKQDSAAARVYRLGLSDPSTLNEDEQVQFSMTMYSVFAQFENIFYQHQERTLDSSIFARHSSAMKFYLQTPGGAEWWASWRDRFSDDFGKFLESFLATNDASSQR